jgi:hypothetical protein
VEPELAEHLELAELLELEGHLELAEEELILQAPSE